VWEGNSWHPHSQGLLRIGRHICLTWRGHEFMDAARNDTVWRKAKTRVMANVGGLAFDVLRATLLADISEHTGLEL
jgi:Hypothetical protein (DUF2513)